MSTTTEQGKSSGRLPAREKIAYGVGSANDVWGNWLLPGILWPVFNVYLGVAPALVSMALLWNRLIDSCSDPFFGWLSDNTRSRFGRRRPFILIGSILAGIGMMLFFWLVQPGWSEGTYYWYIVIASGVLITLVSCFNMPYQSLGAELTPDYHERTSVFAYRGAIQKVAEIGNFAAAAFITMAIFKGDVLHGAKMYSLIIGGLMMVAGVAVFFGVKERYYAKIVESEQKKIGLKETFGGALRCRPFRAQLAMALAYGTCTSMVGTLGLYTTVYYVCNGDWGVGSKWNLAMGASMVLLGAAGVPFFSALARKFGKRHAMMVVQVMAVIAFAATWVLYNPAVPWLQLLAAGMIAFTAAGFWMLYGAIGADVIDYDELETGQRREGAFSACGSYLMKIGLAIGIGGSGFVLQWTGFDEALEGAQSAEALLQMRIYLAAIPIAGLVLAFIFLMMFGLTHEKSEQIREELEKRRGAIG